jgi:hypothetical protein
MFTTVVPDVTPLPEDVRNTLEELTHKDLNATEQYTDSGSMIISASFKQSTKIVSVHFTRECGIVQEDITVSVRYRGGCCSVKTKLHVLAECTEPISRMFAVFGYNISDRAGYRKKALDDLLSIKSHKNGFAASARDANIKLHMNISTDGPAKLEVVREGIYHYSYTFEVGRDWDKCLGHICGYMVKSQ